MGNTQSHQALAKKINVLAGFGRREVRKALSYCGRHKYFSYKTFFWLVLFLAFLRELIKHKSTWSLRLLTLDNWMNREVSSLAPPQKHPRWNKIFSFLRRFGSAESTYVDRLRLRSFAPLSPWPQTSLFCSGHFFEGLPGKNSPESYLYTHPKNRGIKRTPFSFFCSWEEREESIARGLLW